MPAEWRSQAGYDGSRTSTLPFCDKVFEFDLEIKFQRIHLIQTAPTPLGVIHVFNVGQGDTVAIELNDGSLIVIDCVSRTQANRHGGGGLLELIRDRAERRKLPNIDWLCLSHPDWDHAGGMLELINTVVFHGGEILNYITCPFSWKSVEHQYEILRSKQGPPDGQSGPNVVFAASARLRELEARIEELHDGGIGPIKTLWRHQSPAQLFPEPAPANGDFFTIVGPTDQTAGKARRNYITALLDYANRWREDLPPHPSTNALSVNLLLTLRGTRALFTGDTPLAEFDQMLTDYEVRVSSRPIAPHFVKLPHHGSLGGSTQGEEWAAVWKRLFDIHSSPYCVISAAGLTGHHPSKAVLTSLKGTVPACRLCCTNYCSHGSGIAATSGIVPSQSPGYPPMPAPTKSRMHRDRKRPATGAGQGTQEPGAGGSTTRTSPRVCHGTMRFTIFGNGRIESDCEDVPVDCEFHT